MRTLLFSALCLGAALVCPNGTTQAQPPKAAPDFERDIQPLFNRRCVVCHRSDDPVGGMVLEPGYSYDQIVKSPSTESALLRVDPGHPDKSYLQLKIEGRHAAVGKGSQMPPHINWLRADEQALVRSWIANGAKPSRKGQ